MDIAFAPQLTPGTRVVVEFAQAASAMAGAPPILTTGTVTSSVGEHAVLWIDIDIAQGHTLPQMYAVKDILGVLLPMAAVTVLPDGSMEGHVELPPSAT